MQPLYLGLVFSQVFTFVAYALVTIGACLLQRKADTDVRDLMNSAAWPATLPVWNDVFQSAGICAYSRSNHLKFLFQYQWWIIEFELFIFLLTAALTLMPKLIPRVKPVALSLLAAALPLVMCNMNALAFLVRNDTAKSVFEENRLKCTLGGLLLVFIGNMLTIIFMGFYELPALQPSKAGSITYTAETDRA